jgi:hypothetical protein
MSQEQTAKLPRLRQLKPWVRITLKISRWLLVPTLSIIAIIAGMLIGFVYVGGQSLSDAMQWSSWRHVYDLVFTK